VPISCIICGARLFISDKSVALQFNEILMAIMVRLGNLEMVNDFMVLSPVSEETEY
jgi:hypothetical protein